MDNELAIRVFVAVAEESSFSRGARKLGIPQSSASRQVAAIEERIGAKLFQRSTRSLSLTTAGNTFLERAKLIVSEIDDAISSVTDLTNQASGTLRVSMPSLLGRRCIIPLLPEFCKAYPDIKFGMSLTDRVQDIVGLGFDVSIRLGTLPNSGLIARKLMPTSSVLCASPDYLQNRGIPKKPQELQNHDCLQFRSLPGSNIWELTNDSRTERTRVSGLLYSDDGDGLITAALHGLGIVYLPDWVVSEHIKTGRLQSIMPDWRDSKSSALYAVYPSRQHIPRKVAVFVDYLAEKLGKASLFSTK
jgi:DNA-binding transcriptional LysR family regulator